MMKLHVTAGALALGALLAITSQTRASAQSVTFITGRVIGPDNTPSARARVEVRGDNVTLVTTSDVAGRFTLADLAAGTYTIVVRAHAAAGWLQVDLGSAGANVTVHLLRSIATVRSSSRSIEGSGTDLVLNAKMLNRSPARGSLPGLLLQLPGAARGANGVVHLNGDHGDVNYIVDGVPVPQELNREIGSEIDPANVSFMEVLEGAYPAQYGGRFAAIVNVGTNVGNGSSGVDGYVAGGSNATYDSHLGYHTRVGTGSLVLGVRGQEGNRFLDPPNFAAVHDAGSNAGEFLRYTLPRGSDYANLTLIHSYQTFQIPNDVEGGEPSNTDDGETQDDAFLALQLHHALGVHGALTYGLGLKRSRIRDFPDQENDFTYGENLNAASGGSPTDCADGIVAACADSLLADRTARDLVLNAEDYLQDGSHRVRWGGIYDATSVQKLYRITLQPSNFLAPALDRRDPGAPFAVTDDSPNTGHYSAMYAADSWAMGSKWRLDYGLRYDSFAVASSAFRRFFDQVSPRVKLTRIYGQRGDAYLYIGRFFTPFSLENVSPAAAQLLNLPDQPRIAQFDLRPQRDTDVEIGGHLPLGSGELGMRVAQKIAVDLIDDTQVGVTALHQDINYARGNISTQSAYYQQALTRGGRAYMSLAHTRSVNKGCETQLLAPCFGAPTDWTPADHDQRWDVSGGVLLNDARGGWLAVDGEYGSGLSSAYCLPASADCKVPPHTTFDLFKGIGLRNGLAITLRVQNLFNDRYRVTYLNAQGNHYAAGRTLQIGLQFGQDL